MTAAPRAIFKSHAVTLELPEDLYATMQEAVALGLASSQSDFIEAAIRQRAREVRHARMCKLADEAMADPGFVADMQDTMAAFRHVDAEHWPTYNGHDVPVVHLSGRLGTYTGAGTSGREAGACDIG